MIRNGELYHYGVLGMKWGVRKTDAQIQKYIAKRTAKRDKFNVKAERRNYKAEKLEWRVRTGTATARQFKRYSKLRRHGAKYVLKAMKQQRKLSRYSITEKERGQAKTNELLEKMESLTMSTLLIKEEEKQ